MLQLKNTTPLPAKLLLLPDPQGINCVFAVIKATFTLNGVLKLAEEQLPIQFQDDYTGEPGLSGLKMPSDLGMIKPGADVLVLGKAYAPAGQKTTQMDVSLTVGPLAKKVRVLGDRTWQSGLLGGKPSAPAPFETMPLAWEHAFGGTDPGEGDKGELHVEKRNPIGLGFRHANGSRKLDGLKLPNLENPKQLIASWKDRPEPAGLGPLCPQWEPRKTYAGTYDEAWQKKRAPYLPKDFDPRFFQLAPADQVVPGYLKGGEAVELQGASPNEPLRFTLPTLHFQVTYRLDDELHERPANLDTVILEPDRSRLVLLWRSVFPCDKKPLRVREVAVACPDMAGR